METVGIGMSIPRKEAWDKVTGTAKYNNDYIIPGILHAKLVTSTYAHATIKSIDTSEAVKAPGVQAVLLGKDNSVLTGTIIRDCPPIAIDKVRYYGEAVAVVVADSEQEAMAAAKMIKVEYEPLPVVNSVKEALTPNAPLVHENLHLYKLADENIYPEANTNISHRVKIRKGDMAMGWAESDVVVEGSFYLPQTDHLAMETRNARTQILSDGQVMMASATQAPFEVKELIGNDFNVEEGMIDVKTPLVGGAFGGKAAVHLETLAYIASKAVDGRMVKIVNTREEDFITSPCGIGLEAKLKFGATKKGLIKAAEITYMLDSGAYADICPRMAKAMAVDCTGPYNIENLSCDALSVYTNHPFVTSLRGFAHICYAFCIERIMDKLAFTLGIDPLELRLKNAIGPGHTSPTQVKTTLSNTGDFKKCLEKLRNLMNWNEGNRIIQDNNKVRVKGIGCFWKTSNSPTDAESGAILTFNKDGSINLNCGAVEYGPAMKTTLAQILAERMNMDVKRIRVTMEVDTKTSPRHWKTVASMTTFMLGRAVLNAAEDIKRQLCNIAGIVLKCEPEELEVAGERVYLKDDPSNYVDFKDIVHGYKLPNGNAIGGQIIGRGSYVMKHLTKLDPETGQGRPGPAWSVGAQAVEVEFDMKEYTYRVIKAATVVDAGKVINPKSARGVITGGMSMGLGKATREEFKYGKDGAVLNTSLRTYKVIHYGQQPEYVVEFVETPQIDAPYGARGIGEHGTIGIPGALANALSLAVQVDLDQLPLTPELIWKTKTGGNT
ncbi:CO or xanthine dehydrogenase, Mo-binding subunit [Anaerovirgula multivorans]|uniref:CO or xanthine dehydrogenase, Mo-binding subunit n=1 Tax=Anaerovirgula multivorans TaxID=312168 RepID=A0A239IT75_9FIRM|nr:xanthine dehydrogenase family protein molybdopterin-binding subunit [Anaerovirgula multivorans]SNS96830.1 CO or xanthine dehydrogenase, Mo-binding subunit [Anaerovirgula multivorans]